MGKNFYCNRINLRIKKVKVFLKNKIAKKANKAKYHNKNKKSHNLYQAKSIKNSPYYPPPPKVP